MMIILLNMIIAVMSISYETIIEECDAYLVREKLTILLDMDFFIRGSHSKLKETTNLVSFEVDPESKDKMDAKHLIEEQFEHFKSQITTELSDLQENMTQNAARQRANGEVSQTGFEKVFEIIENAQKTNDERYEKL